VVGALVGAVVGAVIAAVIDAVVAAEIASMLQRSLRPKTSRQHGTLMPRQAMDRRCTTCINGACLHRSGTRRPSAKRSNSQTATRSNTKRPNDQTTKRPNDRTKGARPCRGQPLKVPRM
jgi:hypothetical protein